MSIHQKKDGRWFCKYYVGGKEKNHYTGRGDIAERQAILFDEALKAERGRGPKSVSGLTVAHICNEYHKKHYVEDTTRATDFYRLDRTILPLLGRFPADGLTSDHLDKYVEIRLKARVRLRTIDREIDTLRSAYNWASTQDPPLIVKNPLAKFRVPTDKTSHAPAPPSQEEVNKILAHAPEHLARAILIQWYCGLRPGGEISRLSWCDADFDAGELRVESARKGGPIIRGVPLTDDFAAMLRSWRDRDEAWIKKPRKADKINRINLADLAITHFRGRRTLSLKRAWSETKKAAGISRRLRLYDLRHAMASAALRNNSDPKSVSEVLGHSRVDTTLNIYQYVSREQHRAVMGKIPALAWPLKLTTKPKN